MKFGTKWCPKHSRSLKVRVFEFHDMVSVDFYFRLEWLPNQPNVATYTYLLYLGQIDKSAELAPIVAPMLCQRDS